jgi:hypothetical protein
MNRKQREAHARRALAAGRRARSSSSELVATDLLQDEPEVQPPSMGIHERTERGARDGAHHAATPADTVFAPARLPTQLSKR